MIVMVGLAGSGKSVQGKLLAERLGYQWLSVGALLRASMDPKKLAAMARGELVDNQTVKTTLKGALIDLDKDRECVLDGFPRTSTQADWLIAEHKNGNLKISAVIYLVADETVVKQRLLTRARPDDQPAAIEQRLKEYKRVTLPMLEAFKKAQIPIYEVSANQTVDEVHTQIRSALKV